MKKLFSLLAVLLMMLSTSAMAELTEDTNTEKEGEITATAGAVNEEDTAANEEVTASGAVVETEKEVKVYPTKEEFLAAEGAVCKQATDGCNTVTLNEGELWAMTMMYCEDVYGEEWAEEWKCLVYNDEEEKTEEKVEDMAYDTKEALFEAMPMCKTATDWCNNYMLVDGELAASTKMYCEDVYGENGKQSWNCLDDVEVKEELTNDQRFHLHIKETLAEENQAQVQASLDRFESKTTEYTEAELNAVVDVLAGGLDDMVAELLAWEPADKELPEEVNNQYLMLSLLKFELLDLKK